MIGKEKFFKLVNMIQHLDEQQIATLGQEVEKKKRKFQSVLSDEEQEFLGMLFKSTHH